jgi:cupin fold WbuC family metalloprotein
MTRASEVFDAATFDSLSDAARSSPRLRQNRNVHTDFSDPCQRFFNAVEPGSYVRPHREGGADRRKLLVGVRGLFVAILFDEQGVPVSFVPFGQSTLSDGTRPAIGLEIEPMTWNMVVAIESGSILLEVKPGPFDPQGTRHVAPWAPADGSAEVGPFLEAMTLLATEHV